MLQATKTYGIYAVVIIISLVTLSCLGVASENNTTVNTDTLALIPKSTTNSNEAKNSLIVFIGEKIEVTEIPYKPGDFNLGFKAKYKILVRVYGSYAKDTIEFNAYDHYGIPPFSKYKNVMLFVSKEKGKYYHEKYQYYDMYRTKDGQWASPYATMDYGHSFNENTTVKPEKIEFPDSLYYVHKDANKKDLEAWYKAPYYKITGDTVYPLYGNYIPELFRLKKEGVLKARGLF